jgi:5-methylcytosine-specific restriction endonuclease McrA
LEVVRRREQRYARTHPEVNRRAVRRRNNREKAARAPFLRSRQTAEQTRARRQTWKAKNREKLRAQERARYRRNRAKARAKERRRRDFRTIGRDPECQDYAAHLRYDPCSYCGGTAGALDHIVPVVTGGGDNWENVTAACTVCNSRKGAQLLLLAMLGRRLMRRPA